MKRQARYFPTIYDSLRALARRRTVDEKRPQDGRNRKRPQTHSGRRAPAGRTQPQAPADAKQTQITRVLDAVFDKLFLGSTVLMCETLSRNLIIVSPISRPYQRQ